MGTIISFRDISEIKRLQVEMIRMDRLASLGVLASGIAHEIRNPLAGIKTMAQTLEEEMAPGDSRQEYLSRIIRQVNRLDELLKAFFSYARPRPPIKKWHDLPDIVHEVTMLLNKRISSTNVVLEEKYAKNLPQIFVDLNQIQQIFINLILNALDAMPKGGTLTLTAEPVRTALKAVDRRRKNFRRKLQETLYVKVSVQDTGSGIPAEHLDAIFDPFFTTKSQGTGLGLSIVYRILEEHGGEIQVSSKVGKGTTFTLLLPAEE
jgi:signal transduction histidine kinase